LIDRRRRSHKGEIWYVRFDPTIGSEYEKTRPAVVINENFVGRTEMRIVVPVTKWKRKHERWPWMIPLRSNSTNGLKNDSSADASQVKSVSVERFEDRSGKVTGPQLERILSAVIFCIGYECPVCRARENKNTQ